MFRPENQVVIVLFQLLVLVEAFGLSLSLPGPSIPKSLVIFNEFPAPSLYITPFPPSSSVYLVPPNSSTSGCTLLLGALEYTLPFFSDLISLSTTNPFTPPPLLVSAPFTFSFINQSPVPHANPNSPSTAIQTFAFPSGGSVRGRVMYDAPCIDGVSKSIPSRRRCQRHSPGPGSESTTRPEHSSCQITGPEGLRSPRL